MHSRIVVAVNWTFLACGQEMSRGASQPCSYQDRKSVV